MATECIDGGTEKSMKANLNMGIGHKKKNPKKPIIEVEKEITCDVDLSS